MWTSHLDTADSFPEHVTFERSVDKTGDEIIETDGRTILGADCKIGVAIMIKMIEARIPGWYAFFAGEEIGRVGSDALARRLADKVEKDKTTRLPNICISFDRLGTYDIITHQMGRRTCSHTFALALGSIFNKHPEFNYRPCDRGSFTDSFSFCGIISECTNVSVGYSSQHSKWEEQNMTHAQHLLDIILEHRELFESLPVDRDYYVKEEKPVSTFFSGFAGHSQPTPQTYGYYPGGHLDYKVANPMPANSSDTTEQTELVSGTVGTRLLESHSQSGSPLDTSVGTAKSTVTSSSQPQQKARKMTKAEKKAAKRLRRAEIKAKQKQSGSGSKVSDKNSSTHNKQIKTHASMSGNMSSTSIIEVASRPFVEVTSDMPYQGYLHLMQGPVQTYDGDYYKQTSTHHWLKDTTDFSHGGISLADHQYVAAGHDDHDDTFEDDYDDLFDEMTEAYDKGELTSEEEEEYLVKYLKVKGTNNTNDIDTPCQHGHLITWYECAGCEIIQKELGWSNPVEPMRCEGCGDVVERKIYRYDADVKLYVPISGDITDAIPPHLIP